MSPRPAAGPGRRASNPGTGRSHEASRPLLIKDGYLQGRACLAASASLEPALEAEMLLRFVLRMDRARFYAHWDEPLAAGDWERYHRLLEERGAGRPVHYIVGEREFMGLAFAVDERVVIPRPETELLVEFAASWLRGRAHPLVVDAGTGSGCIAVSLARLLRGATIYATDRSTDALEVAQLNVARHGVAGQVTLLPGDLLTPLPSALRGRVDAVLSNPPYVPESAAPELPREIRDFEPLEAILTPGDGMMHHRRLAVDALEWLAPGGLLAVEVGAGQADPVRDLLASSGRYGRVGAERDGGGTGRVVWGGVEK